MCNVLRLHSHRGRQVCDVYPGLPLTVSTSVSVVRAYVTLRARKMPAGTKCLSMEGPASADSRYSQNKHQAAMLCTQEKNLRKCPWRCQGGACV